MENDISFLVSPVNNTKLKYKDDNRLVDAEGNEFPIINKIPRFVNVDNYASSFGFQWNLFSKIQIDKYNGTTISKDRLFKETRWNPNKIRKEKVLEVGSGAGRFTQVLLDSGADVYSVDYSNAVETNYKNNGPNENLHLCQANIYELPFEYEYFDKIICFGVLQHTPDVKKAFMSMLPFLKKGGQIAIDVYPKTWKTYFWSKYFYRIISKNIAKEKLLKIIKHSLPIWLPVSTLLLRIPKVGFYLSQIIPNSNYTFIYPQLSKDQILQWAIMDTFDMLSPAYDQPQTLKEIRKWLVEANLKTIYCGEGGTGFVAIGEK